MPNNEKLTQEERLELLKEEVLAADQARLDAWADFSIHRAMLWDFHPFLIISQTRKKMIAQGKRPGPDFETNFNQIRKKLISRVENLPEFEKYQDKRQEYLEARNIYLLVCPKNQDI